MTIVHEHIYEEMGELSDNYEFLEVIQSLEDTCYSRNVYEYFNEVAKVYKASGREYYVYNTKLVDDYDNINGYITKFRNKEDMIYYLLDNDYAEDFDELDSRIN